MNDERCACGRLLHYSNPVLEQFVRSLIADRGPDVPVTVGGRTWLVPRHYIALHGLKAAQLPTLGFPDVTSVVRT